MSKMPDACFVYLRKLSLSILCMYLWVDHNSIGSTGIRLLTRAELPLLDDLSLSNSCI